MPNISESILTLSGMEYYEGKNKDRLDSELAKKAEKAHTHNSEDIISLDASKLTGMIDLARLPQGALERLYPVENDEARFALTINEVQNGDTVKVNDTKMLYIVVDDTKLSSEEGYTEYTAGLASSVPWTGVTDKPDTYTPSKHSHTVSEITDFPESMPASDVSDWAKATTKPDYTKDEIGLSNVDNTADADKSVKHATSADSATNATKVNNHTVETDVPANAVFTDTTYSNFVKSGSGAKNGLVPAPSTTAGIKKYLREDGTWQTPPNTNTWTAFKGATSSAAGTAGYVPAPAKGEQDKFFRADGTWQTVSAGGNKTAYQSSEPTGQSNNDEWLKEY